MADIMKLDDYLFHPVIIWILTFLLLLMFGYSGMLNLMMPDYFTEVWGDWGVSRGVVIFIGLLQIGGMLGILFPKIASLSSGVLAVLMAITFFFSGISEAWSGVYMSIFGFILCALLLYIRWGDRFWQPSTDVSSNVK